MAPVASRAVDRAAHPVPIFGSVLPVGSGVHSLWRRSRPTPGRRRRAAMAWASALELLTELRIARLPNALPLDVGVTSMASVEAQGRRRRAAMAWASALELLTELPAVPVFRTYTTAGRRRHVVTSVGA